MVGHADAYRRDVIGVALDKIGMVDVCDKNAFFKGRYVERFDHLAVFDRADVTDRCGVDAFGSLKIHPPEAFVADKRLEFGFGGKLLCKERLHVVAIVDVEVLAVVQAEQSGERKEHMLAVILVTSEEGRKKSGLPLGNAVQNDGGEQVIDIGVGEALQHVPLELQQKFLIHLDGGDDLHVCQCIRISKEVFVVDGVSDDAHAAQHRDRRKSGVQTV